MCEMREIIDISYRVRGSPFYFVLRPTQKNDRGEAEVIFLSGPRYEIKYGDPSTRYERRFFSGLANNSVLWSVVLGVVMLFFCSSSVPAIHTVPTRDEVMYRMSRWCPCGASSTHPVRYFVLHTELWLALCGASGRPKALTSLMPNRLSHGWHLEEL